MENMNQYQHGGNYDNGLPQNWQGQYPQQQIIRQYIVEERVVPEKRRSNKLATTGLVLSIIGLALFWLPFANFVLWLLGFIFSLIGVFRSPRGKAIAGLAVSSVAIIGILILLTSLR